jgi:hypothetical protein
VGVLASLSKISDNLGFRKWMASSRSGTSNEASVQSDDLERSCVCATFSFRQLGSSGFVLHLKRGTVRQKWLIKIAS